jgi:predicted MFS family arabinose efflux permease
MGFIIARFGWVGPYPVVASLGMVSLISLAWLLPRDPPPDKNAGGLKRNLSAVLTYLPALSGLGMGVMLSTANELVNLVFGVWMEDSFGLKIAALGAASAVIGFSELSGEGLTAALVDRLGKARAVAIGLGCNILALLALPLLGRSVPGALTGLFFFYLSFEFTLVSSIPLMSEVVPSARATLMASNAAALSLGRALGALLATPLYSLGFSWTCLAAIAFNIVALLALNKLQIGLREKERGLSAGKI